MTIKLNTFAKNIVLDGIIYGGNSPSSPNNTRFNIALFTGAMPSTPPSSPSTSSVNAQRVWQPISTTSSSTDAPAIIRNGDVISLGSGLLTNNASGTGTVTWAYVFNLASGDGFITDSVGLQGSNSIVQVSTLNAVNGQPLSLVSVSMRLTGV